MESTAAKIGPILANLSAEYKEAAAKGVKPKSFKSTNGALRIGAGRIAIDAYATDGAAFTKSLRTLGATKITHLEDAVGALSVKLDPDEVAYLEEPYMPHRIVGHQ